MQGAPLGVVLHRCSRKKTLKPKPLNSKPYSCFLGLQDSCKLVGPLLGVPIIRSMAYWAVYWGHHIYGNYLVYRKTGVTVPFSAEVASAEWTETGKAKAYAEVAVGLPIQPCYPPLG